MREILFRAKRICDSEWIEGFYVGLKPNLQTMKPESCHRIYGLNTISYDIDPETLCQYTELKDKNGKRIWDNDIVKHEVSDTIGTVKWYQEDYVGWCVDDVVIDEQQFTDEMWNECEVIGNIFDNPKLLKGE